MILIRYPKEFKKRFFDVTIYLIKKGFLIKKGLVDRYFTNQTNLREDLFDEKGFLTKKCSFDKKCYLIQKGLFYIKCLFNEKCLFDIHEG